ncbi:MAG: multidrug/hemolysin transport system ATP-binding protein [Clostridiales bacterium]|jgi:multidrug/hemolysin transport system ATP-binding protein|nr:multidrug/hemolysin transport system ATP-binding protein [Clostridiales bacterium]MDN5297628.1 multidrug/hemolysin transport system ATP-binding protein [Clostridiales bacterium]
MSNQSSNDTIIEVKSLKKSYGQVEAVKSISFYVERGKLFAFLGPNGAGKSTTIDMICTFLKPDSGSAVVNGFTLGKDDAGIRSSIGAVFQDSLLDGLLTVEENLRSRGAFYGLSGSELTTAIENAMTAVDITALAKRPYGKLSGGQRRRCDIARALINTPKILFLDEPTTGLDPQTRQSVWHTIQKLQRENGMTVFLTTHYMEEAAEADYVVVIDDGNIAAKGTPAELRAAYAKDKLVLHCHEVDAVSRILSALSITGIWQGSQVTINLEQTMAALPIVHQCESYIHSFEVSIGTMDDAFIGITGKEIRQ